MARANTKGDLWWHQMFSMSFDDHGNFVAPHLDTLHGGAYGTNSRYDRENKILTVFLVQHADWSAVAESDCAIRRYVATMD